MNNKKRYFAILIFTFIFTLSVSYCDDNIKLIPVGKVVYIHSLLKNPVVEQPLSKDLNKLKPNDQILSIKCNSKGTVKSLKDIQDLMKLHNEILDVNFSRNGNLLKISMTSDELRLYKFSSIYGCIGTITAVDENGNFVGLSHSLNSNKELNTFSSIEIFETDFIQQRMSFKDDVGFLVANNIGNYLGKIDYVDDFGVKGMYNNFKFNPNQALSISKPKSGKAYILCTNPITNELSLHDIIIIDVDEYISSIKVTDPSLLKFRGGIVKGMSGSPVIQDNKIVGGVRSTQISNPEEGYITNIHSMLGIN